MYNILKPICAGLLCLFCASDGVGQFLFSYDGPDTLYVDSSCTAILDWGHPETPEVFPTMPGQVIISWMIHSISGGYMIGDSIPAGVTVTVFYQARDNMGHISLYGFNLPVVDNTPPVFDPETFPDDVTVACASDVPVSGIGYSDNCSDSTEIDLTVMDSGGSDVCMGGIVSRTYIITDASGNTASYIQQITVMADTSAPVITGMPENGSAPCGNATDAYNTWLAAQRAAFMADDIGCGIAELSDNAPTADVLLGFCGDLEIAFFATDSCDNTTSVIVLFTVTNTVAPTITVEASDGMANCSGGDPESVFNTWLASHGGADATDDCSLINWSTDPAMPDFYDLCNTPFPVTFIADDGCGNTATTTAEFLLEDNTSPVIGAQAQSSVINCSTSDWMVSLGNWLSNHANAMATDICTHEDSLAVQFMLNGMLLDSAGVVSAFHDSITDGTCVDGVIINGFVQDNVLGMINLGFVFSDNCGNASTTSAIFAVKDAVGPQFVVAPQDSILTCAGGDIETLFSAWYTSGGFAESTDDCDVVYYSGTPSYEEALETLMEGLDTACASGVTVDVTFMVHDYCGNTNPNAETATFGIVDNTGPMFIQPPSDLTFGCSGTVQSALVAWLDSLGGAEVQEACGDIAWVFSWEEGGMMQTGMPGIGPYPAPGSISCSEGLEVLFSATDVCDNTISESATFTAIDTVGPVITLDSVVTIPCDSLDQIVLQILDNCTQEPVVDFIDMTMGGDTTSCLNGTILRTWTVTDHCGNSATAMQTIHTQDLEAPEFIVPADTVIYCASGQIDAGVPAMVADNCDPDPVVTYADETSGSACNTTINRTWSVSDACGNINTAVQVISLSDTLAPVVEVAPADLTIACGDPAEMAATLAGWMVMDAGASLTDGCGGVVTFIAMQGSYSLDDTTTWPGMPPVLPMLICGSDTLGGLTVDFVYSDDCGNASVLSLGITVIDTAAPVIIHCAPDTIITLEASLCAQQVVLSPPHAMEVCLAILDTSDIIQSMPIASPTPGDTFEIVDTIVFDFTVPAPPEFIASPVTLEIVIEGADIDTTTEYFNILGDNGEILGTTTTGETECDSSSTLVSIPADVFGTWALDGNVGITLVPNSDPGGEHAINHICPSGMASAHLRIISGVQDSLKVEYAVDTLPRVALDTVQDVEVLLSAGMHTITWFVTDCAGNEAQCETQVRIVDQDPPDVKCPDDMTIDLTDADECIESVILQAPEFTDSCGVDAASVMYRVSGDTVITTDSFGDADSIEIELMAGRYVVTYTVSDLSGNTATCTFTVTIEDPVPPMAVCQDAEAFIHPSGTIPLQVDPEIFDNESSDNCRVDSMIVVPGIFPCDSAGTDQLVQLIVFDASGNADTCSAILHLEVQAIIPTYQTGLCLTDTLELFANVPPVGGNPYSFEWSGPNGFLSTDENPIIPDADSTFSGTYTVVVTGAGGCTSSGSVEVVISSDNAPGLTVVSAFVCEGEEVILNASTYNVDVTYSWYRGIPPGGLLLGMTNAPTFTDNPPISGTYTYYVTAGNANCTTSPSQSVEVEVVEIPVATVIDAFIEVCQGGIFALGTEIAGPGITYQWTGPAGFTSDAQYPPAIDDVQLHEAGTYQLVIVRDGCASTPAETDVAVSPAPERPVISGDSVFCLSGILVLVADSVTEADQFIWQSPQMQGISTMTNTLTLNNITEGSEGAWTVTAMLGDCPSEESEPFTIAIEEMLPVEASNTGPFCAGSGDSITLLVDVSPGFMYQWEGPGGYASTEANPLVPGLAGTYTVTVTSSTGCSNTATTVVMSADPPSITALSNTAGECADSSQSLTFATTLFPPDNGSYTYAWTGPNGFSSDEMFPVIPGLSSELNGTYTLIVSVGSCSSEPVTTQVQVMDAPSQPEITGAQMFCSGETLTLTTYGYPGDSVLYIWHTPTGIIQIWNDSTLTIDKVSTTHSGNYWVVVHIDGCDSRPSEDLSVLISQVVSQPIAQAPATICAGDSLVLSTAFVPGGNYFWSGPDGFTSLAQNPVISPVPLSASGSYQVYVQVGDCLSDTSESVQVDVQPLPANPVTEAIDGSVCLGAPDPVELCLTTGSLTSGATYTWSFNGTPLGNSTSMQCMTLTDFMSFAEGVNTIEVSASLNGCVSDETGTVTLQAYEFPEEVADAGADGSYCVNDEVMLIASQPGTGTGMWSSPDQMISFEDPHDPFTVVDNLSEGINILVWTLDYESCIAYSSDTVIVSLESTPGAMHDTIEVPFGQTVEFNVILNDLVPSGYTVTLLPDGPDKGNVLYLGNGRVRYDPNLGFIGTDRLSYEICSELCPDQCTTADVILRVASETDCFIPSIFTPNGDGTNDRLIIPCLETEQFSSNRILIFNEWGDTVYEAQPYKNNWDGTRDGKDLAVGTYFYVIDFGDGRPVQSGFLVLER